MGMHMAKELSTILQSANNILLIDWPDVSLPRTLISAGFTVFSYSPGGYSKALLTEDIPDYTEGKSIFRPANEEESGYLIFQRLNSRPDTVDIVNVYRPEGEHAGIITNHALPLKAKAFWLHPPLMSSTTADLARKNSLIFVEGINIADVARKIRNP